MKRIRATDKDPYPRFVTEVHDYFVIDLPSMKIIFSVGIEDASGQLADSVTMIRSQEATFEVEQGNPPQEVTVLTRRKK